MELFKEITCLIYHDAILIDYSYMECTNCLLRSHNHMSSVHSQSANVSKLTTYVSAFEESIILSRMPQNMPQDPIQGNCMSELTHDSVQYMTLTKGCKEARKSSTSG